MKSNRLQSHLVLLGKFLNLLIGKYTWTNCNNRYGYLPNATDILFIQLIEMKLVKITTSS